MKDLKVIIEAVESLHKEFSLNWVEQLNESYKFNYKKKTVFEAYNNEDLYTSINAYLEFIEKGSMELFFNLNSITISSKLEFRIKKEKSIELKLDNYLRKPQQGKVPLSKTLNDLFGVRVILNETYTYQEICDFILNNFNSLKCIDSSKGDYKATHIYFNYNNNNTFQWELQVWSKENEIINKTSHSKYKQAYTIWEDETNGYL